MLDRVVKTGMWAVLILSLYGMNTEKIGYSDVNVGGVALLMIVLFLFKVW